jgi:hypothetical protein
MGQSKNKKKKKKKITMSNSSFSVLENDLRQLSVAAGKKFPSVKDAAERAMGVLRGASRAEDAKPEVKI